MLVILVFEDCKSQVSPEYALVLSHTKTQKLDLGMLVYTLNPST